MSNVLSEESLVLPSSGLEGDPRIDTRLYDGLVAITDAISNGNLDIISIDLTGTFDPGQLQELPAIFDAAQGKLIYKQKNTGHDPVDNQPPTLDKVPETHRIDVSEYSAAGSRLARVVARRKTGIEDHEDLGRKVRRSKLIGKLSAGLMFLSAVGFGISAYEDLRSDHHEQEEAINYTHMIVTFGGLTIAGTGAVVSEEMHRGTVRELDRRNKSKYRPLRPGLTTANSE